MGGLNTGKPPIVSNKMQKSRLYLIICLVFIFANVHAQNKEHTHSVYGIKPCTWDEFVDLYSSSCFDENNDSQISEERLDALRNIYDNPININKASREDLQELPFLSDAQTDSLLSYVKRHYPVISLGELALVPRFDYRTRFFLTAFLTCDTTIVQKQTVKDLLVNGRHDIAANFLVPLNTPEGCKSNTTLSVPNRYLGDKNRIGFKYFYNCNNELKFGFTSEKDPGEPFACRGNFLMDSYSFSIFRKQRNGKYAFAIGDYRINLGEGLTIGNVFFSGKKGVLYDTYNNPNTITPHLSYSERDFFRGAAGSIRFGKSLLTAMLSYKPDDAVTNSVNEITSLINTGYHRTSVEQNRRGNVNDFTAGGDFTYGTRLLSAGISAAFVHYDKYMNPRQADYNRYAMRGKNFRTLGLHYSFCYKDIKSRGEIATTEKNALAFVNTIKYTIGNQTTLTSIQRSYSKKYNTPYADCFKSSGTVSNEQGVYFGFSTEPFRFLSFRGYGDFYRRPWSTFRYRAPLNGSELCFEAEIHNSKKAFISAEWKYTKKKCDAGYSTDSTSQNRNQIKLMCGGTFGKFSTKTQITVITTSDKGVNNHGWAVAERACYRNDKLSVAAFAAYFKTDNYSTRVYAYENTVRYIYNNFTSLYGNGIRASLLCSTKFAKRFTAYAKYGLTKYFDRNKIGSGAQQISSSAKSDLTFCINIII